MRRAKQSPRSRGTALVEFALVMIPLFVLIFGIITYGYLLSFKQNLTEAAADGARAAAFVPAGEDVNPVNGRDDRLDEAEEAVDLALEGFGRSCDDPADGLTCTVLIVDCDGPGLQLDECISVEIEFDNTGPTALLPEIPLVSQATPDTVTAKSIVESQ